MTCEKINSQEMEVVINPPPPTSSAVDLLKLFNLDL